MLGKKKWIGEAIKCPSSLRETLHVKEGCNIPEAKLEKAEHSKNPLIAKRAELAETFKSFKK